MHLHPYAMGRSYKPTVYPFLSSLLLGIIASSKYMSDYNLDYVAMSGRSERNARLAYSIALTLGAEQQYGTYGYVFNALELVENNIFVIRSGTGEEKFGEMHIFDVNFRPEIAASSGAYVNITKGYALIPEGKEFKNEFLEVARSGKPLAINSQVIFQTSNSWLHLNPQLAEWWINNRILFYDLNRFRELTKFIDKSNTREGFFFGHFVARSIRKKLNFSGNDSGEIFIVDHINDSSPTYQGDYSGPLFAYITDAQLKEKLKREVDLKSGFYDFTKRFEDFLDKHLKEFKHVRQE